ncbi:uncharacterized protein KY384_005490 [Bacidia gigantensis]|uniref:uncharacterized protein n=1 Tax=Bacidia gigantensis TaxID=2732470 RepID=UPI001D0565C1|nr:uncharacterized protein KY384_005490 [Bacidia gigantensis]KAG8530008.1 hypothetical protein KY384_005490 [Bacidia gigantensis]
MAVDSQSFANGTDNDTHITDSAIVGIIGMGDMGKMYARRIGAAGWRVKACDQPEKYDALRAEFSENNVCLSAAEHDRITADTQAVTHAAFLSMGTAWQANNQFPWEIGRYIGGIENVKCNIMLRIYSNRWHVYAGLAILNPQAKEQIRQYAQSSTELFKLMLSGNRKEFEVRIRSAGEAVFGSARDSKELLLRDDLLDRFSLSNVSQERTPNNHLSLLAMVDCWSKLGIVPYEHMICSTPPFRLWLGVTEYLFKSSLLDEAIETAFNDLSFRADDLEFTVAARGMSLILILQILIRGENTHVSSNAPMESLEGDDGKASLFVRPTKTHITISRDLNPTADSAHFHSGAPRSWADEQAYTKPKASFLRQNSSQQDDVSFTPEYEKEDGFSAPARSDRPFYARAEQRSIVMKGLPEKATHKDIVNFVRGGAVLDIYLRTNDRSASISFVEGAAAHQFMAYAKRNDIYLQGKRLEFSWNERQFILPGHVANKIGIGATRNLVIRGVHNNITEERLRDDLDHIHNLVVIEVTFERGDAFIELNSIHNSLFARTCMMSRTGYRGMKIEWYPDECSQPLPKKQSNFRKENRVPSPSKRLNTAVNRFQMLGIDGTEDGSSTDEEPGTLSNFSSLNVNSRSPWNVRPIAA